MKKWKASHHPQNHPRNKKNPTQTKTQPTKKNQKQLIPKDIYNRCGLQPAYPFPLPKFKKGQQREEPGLNQSLH